MNESAILQSSFIRDSDVAGAMSGTYDSLCLRFSKGTATLEGESSYPPLVQKFLNLTASSGGRSTTIKPLTPASLESFNILSSP